ncbi:hypothetical protein CR164_00790 [Prosthecochloris marina]|uniref:DUF4403 domain-containing protein n=1 Tax=Prosthecochloris marina TaxID=2017681 RepID=A0A317TB22_9CHLB|nr:DUF4403 family protein [Prosthecochloris marina]PWW83127.1 hypothetical protein CR164_00790 [Prosthecochloris marina]
MKKAFIIIGIFFAVTISIVLAFLLFIEIQQPKPPQAVQKTVSVTVPASTINLPITYQVEQLANYLNNKITGTFLEKNIFLNSGKEEIYLTLTKKEKITVSSTGKQLICTLPLTVDGTLINSSLGKTLSKLFKPVSTSLSITLATPVSLDSNWNLSTRFEIKGYEWLSKPILQIGPFKIDIKEHLDKEIQQKSHELTRMLDEQINEEVSLQPTVAGVWKDLQRPILINKRPTAVWLKFVCEDIQGNIELDQEKITCFASLKAKPLIITDTTKSSTPLPLPSFKTLDKDRQTRQSDIFIYAYTSFDTLNEQLNRFLRNKSFSAEGFSTRIKNIRAYASVNGLTVEVETDKILNSSFFISGQPVFEASTQKLKIHNFDFTIESKNMFMQAGEEILHNNIKEAITSRLNVNLGSVIERVPELVHQAVSKEKAGKTISLTLDGLTIKNCDIALGAEKIHIVANVLTEANIHLKRIKTGKRITITDN